MTPSELKECPFCGCRAEYVMRHNTRIPIAVQCHNFGCGAQIDIMTVDLFPHSRWNQRWNPSRDAGEMPPQESHDQPTP